LSTGGAYATSPQLTAHATNTRVNVQLINAPSSEQFPAIELALQPERVACYMAAGGKRKEGAFSVYLWNCSIGEAFYIPLHFCEVACRNGVHRALIARLGEKWYSDSLLTSLMDERFARELKAAIEGERKKLADEARRQRREQAEFTCHHVVSAVTFGFWEHLTTKRFARLLWAKGIRVSFPHAPKDKTYEDLQRLIESVRRWRNRIFHHEPLFDKSPSRKHQDAMELLSWTCCDTSAWVRSVSRVQAVINDRPTII
jgi:hypothetical protein